jgi:YidC/Oxa1 family membrane protein insertase
MTPHLTRRSMEKRLFLAIFLSTAILILYNLIVYRHLDKREVPFPHEVEEAAPAPQKVEMVEPKEAMEIPREDLLLETDLLRIELSPGGEVEGWWLKNFKEKGVGEEVNMVQVQPPVRPLGLSIHGERIIPDAFQSCEERRVFIYESSPLLNGVRIEKIFTLGEDPYTVKVDLLFKNPTQEEIDLEGFSLGWRGGTLNLFGEEELGDVGHVYFDGERLRKIRHKGREGFFRKMMTSLGLAQKRPHVGEEIKPSIKPIWISQKGRYFLTLIIPTPHKSSAIFRRTKEGFLEMELLAKEISVPPLGSKTLSYKIYGGPKDYEILKRLYPGAEGLAGLNLLSLLTVKTLRFFYGFCHNYGVAIILLAVVIKVLLYPLSHASLKSMRSMQRLQPEMNRLRAKYKDDREQLHREIMLLYRRHKVNPLSGCFPLLLQLPVLYAIFTALRGAVELRGAPFILWIKDLSEHDPFYVLPLMMGGTMFIQQRLSIPDPQQAKGMIIMTVVFTFLFMHFPSGLVLYWLFQNILAIGQQLVINRIR